MTSKILLTVSLAVVIVMMLCASFQPARAQQDPTIMARQGELSLLTARAQAATQAVAAAAAKSATAQRQAELNILHDAETRTVMQITASAATAVYWGGKTQTPIAMTAQASQATSTAQVIATATGFAQATGTAQATATQIAGTAIARQTQTSGTATATVIYATAAARATAAANEQHQITLSHVRQAVYIICALLVVFFGPILSYAIYKRWADDLPKPVVVKPVEIVEQEETTPARGSVSFDPAIVNMVVNEVRQDMQREVAQ